MKKEFIKKLTKIQQDILLNKGTEAPFSGEFLENKKKGIYSCVGCGNELFSSETKFESGSGWPSFYDVLKQKNIKLKKEKKFFGRIEVLCAKCKGHLGHVFDDGPNPTGKRYCINSAALKFKKN